MTLTVSNLRKSYGMNMILNGVDMTLSAGRVRALLGPNGAGKSTLVSCLTAAHQPDSGEIDLDGVNLVGLNPAAARRAGVAAIYQSFSLVGVLSAADNIFLGDEIRRGPFINHAEQIRQASLLFDQLGVEADPSAPVEDLPVGLRQMVEIAKAVHHEARLLILDEPTAALSEREANVLLSRVRALAASGVAILYVSHRLNEIFRVCDDVTVLRDGNVVEDDTIDAFTPASLAEAISPNALGQCRITLRTRTTVGLQIDAFRSGPVGPIDLQIREGEIVGVFGLLGAGRTELLEGLAGARPRTGRVLVGSGELKGASVKRAISAGLMLVPGDRKTGGIFDSFTAAGNVVLPHIRALARFGLRRPTKERSTYAEVANQLQIVPPDPVHLAANLSGGNQQKLVVGRWLPAEHLRVILLDEPTQGVDVGARAQLYERLEILAQNGTAVVFSTSEPSEVFALARRVLVLCHGRVTLDSNVNDIDEARLLTAATSDFGGQP